MRRFGAKLFLAMRVGGSFASARLPCTPAYSQRTAVEQLLVTALNRSLTVLPPSSQPMMMMSMDDEVSYPANEIGAMEEQPSSALGTQIEASVPDLLDDQQVGTSQALVPIQNEASYSQALVPVDGQLVTVELSTEVIQEQKSPDEQKVEVAPTIAGIGRIQRNKTPRQAPKKREIIKVPERSINGGLEFKFESDPSNVDLCDLLTPDEYTDAITTLNDTLRPSRSKKVDTGLLITGPLILPLALWGVRHSKQVKKRKLLLVEGIDQFNDTHAALYMRYVRSGSSSYLTIERRKEEHQTKMAGLEELEESWMDREPVV